CAFAVTNGSGIRTSAFRTDAEGAAGIEIGNRPTTRSDSMNVHHRNADRHSIHLTFVSHRDAAFAKSNVRGRTTHIEGDEIFISARPADMKPAHTSTSRSG